MAEDFDSPTRLADILGSLPAVKAVKKVKPLSRVHQRLIAQPEEGDETRLAFQHTVFCQTSLPYRNLGDGVRLWEREQGKVSLRVEAGAARHPKTGKWVELGLPWGTKPRLILASSTREMDNGLFGRGGHHHLWRRPVPVSSSGSTGQRPSSRPDLHTLCQRAQ
jgi:hypothetical protein